MCYALRAFLLACCQLVLWKVRESQESRKTVKANKHPNESNGKQQNPGFLRVGQNTEGRVASGLVRSQKRAAEEG